MTINEFIGSAETMEQHVINDYVPLERKQAVATSIAESIYLDGTRSTVVRYMLERIALVELYTDLERGENVLNEYNALAAIGAFQTLEKLINPAELTEFRNIVEAECNDYEYNNLSLRAYVSGQVERFGKLIDTTFEAIAPSLEKINWEEMVKQVK